MIGCHEMSLAEYLRDPCKAPSLSSSIIKALLDSPRKAWWTHPKLNPAWELEVEERFDLGSACHAYILEGARDFVIVEAADWRTKTAQEQRNEARAAGQLALLAEQWQRVQAMAAAINPQFHQHEDPPIPFTNGRPEKTLIWQEGEVWCRARLDWLHDDSRTVDDLKTVEGSANPEAWTRTLFNLGFDIQAAWYTRGVKAIFGIEPTFRFVVAEVNPPYAVSVVGLGPEAMALANRKVNYAIKVWGKCLQANVWPGYPRRTAWADLPPWAEAAWLAKEIGHDDIKPVGLPLDDGRPLAAQLFGKE